MSLLITVEKLYFMDGIYRVTAQTEKPLNPDVDAYITHLTIETVKSPRLSVTSSYCLFDRLLKYACSKIAEEYRLATLQALYYNTNTIRITNPAEPTYPDYRQAIEGVEGVYLTD